MYRYHITTKQAWGGFCVQLDERGHLSHQHVNLAGTPLKQGMGLGSFKNVYDVAKGRLRTQRVKRMQANQTHTLRSQIHDHLQHQL
jgi:hypothetical protein